MADETRNAAIRLGSIPGAVLRKARAAFTSPPHGLSPNPCAVLTVQKATLPSRQAVRGPLLPPSLSRGGFASAPAQLRVTFS